jgi:hypothetical protein
LIESKYQRRLAATGIAHHEQSNNVGTLGAHLQWPRLQCRVGHGPFFSVRSAHPSEGTSMGQYPVSSRNQCTFDTAVEIYLWAYGQTLMAVRTPKRHYTRTVGVGQIKTVQHWQ